VSGVGAVAGVAAFYKLVRPYFPVKVNCHFCNHNFKVPYNDQNGWTCPDCGQYNGWNEDGDYNKILDISSQNKTRFVQGQMNSPSNNTNGLCKSCNLNQELKISQLAKCPHEGAQLEEYRDHLEQVYRLCPLCEDHLASRLAEQDRSLAGKLLEWRLENSRLNSSRDHGNGAMPRSNNLLLSVSLFLFSLFQTFSSLSIPGCFTNTTSDKINDIVINHFPLSLNPGIVFSQMTSDSWLPTVVSLTVGMILVSARKRLYSLVVINCLLLAWSTFELPLQNGFQLLFSGISVLLSAFNSNKLIYSKSRRTKKVDAIHNGSKLTQPPVLKQQDSREETKTHDLLSSSGSDLDSPVSLISGINKPLQPQTQLFSPKPGLLRSSNELSFNHEFATVASDDERDCDLSSLSLGDYRTSSPAPSVTSPFSLRSYSPSPSNISLFSPKPRSRPLIQPARLTSTSWVAGGYWQPPPVSSPGPAMSRSSSQSSGFISGAPSVASYNYHSIRTPTPTHSVVSEAYNPGHPFPVNATSVRLRRTTVEESISDISNPGEHLQKAAKSCSEKPDGWTFTVTITKTGVLLTFSVLVNVAVAIAWITSS